MKIAVCGSGLGENKDILEKAKEIGKEIAKTSNILLTGGCGGYPYSAVRGAVLENGAVVGYSPAKDKDEHVSSYGFPFEEDVEYVFTGKGIPGRNIPLVDDADSVIILDGQIGTLNEFTLAFNAGKKIGVLEVGKLYSVIPKIISICDKNGESKNIKYSGDSKELVKLLLS